MNTMSDRHYTVIAACGSSIATSTLMASKIEELFKKNNIKGTVIKSSLNNLEENIKAVKPDLVITSFDPKRNFGVPVIVGLPYITGIGKSELDKKILEILKEKS
ncbi:PTS galactitol transporter subunit IIB [Thermoanaerobacteraceae bacterium SP2]|nr:PTS galactitol transporter subunit IIB [Thermoanaerobacteraceae bacterium SP2]